MDPPSLMPDSGRKGIMHQPRLRSVTHRMLTAPALRTRCGHKRSMVAACSGQRPLVVEKVLQHRPKLDVVALAVDLAGYG